MPLANDPATPKVKDDLLEWRAKGAGGALLAIAHRKKKPNVAEWAVLVFGSLPMSIDKMVKAGMTASQLAAWSQGFSEEIVNFLLTNEV